MRDLEDNKGIWAKVVRISRSRITYRDLQVHESSSGPTNMPQKMSRFLQQLEHCNDKIAEVLHDNLQR